MSWTCEFSEDAKKDLVSLPKAIQKRVARVLAQMAHDPFQGDIKPLLGKEWKGVFRRRMAGSGLVDWYLRRVAKPCEILPAPDLTEARGRPPPQASDGLPARWSILEAM
jgi:mRNA-degrading endonuclease RelE of RelBE toxin-antitoxin system